jgi:hypothetical protein
MKTAGEPGGFFLHRRAGSEDPTKIPINHAVNEGPS